MPKRTIRLYLLFTAITNLGMSFIMATYAMFLISRGLNLFEVNLVNFVFFTTLFLCEIPTGVFADVFGRKPSFVVSCFLLSLSMFIYALSSSFLGFVLAEIIGAIGTTFATGAFQAWLVDKLKSQKYTGSLGPIFSKEQQIWAGAGIIGAIAGAFLADKNIAFPWVASGVVMSLAGVLAVIFIREEGFVRQSFSLKRNLEIMGKTVKVSVRYGLSNKAVRFILLIGVFHAFAIQAPNMQWQVFFSQFLNNKISLGFIFGGIAICLIIGAIFSPRFFHKEKRALIISQLVVGVGLITAALSNLFPVALAMFLLHEAARGFSAPLKNTYLNNNIPSQERATLISFESMARHLGGMAGLIFSGLVAEQISVPAAWIFSGGILITATLWLARNGKT